MKFRGKTFKDHYVVDFTYKIMRLVGIMPPKFTSSQVRLQYYIKIFFVFMYVLGKYYISQDHKLNLSKITR